MVSFLVRATLVVVKYVSYMAESYVYFCPGGGYSEFNVTGEMGMRL